MRLGGEGRQEKDVAGKMVNTGERLKTRKKPMQRFVSQD